MELLNGVRVCKLDLLKSGQISPRQWNLLQQMRYKYVNTVKDSSELILYKTIMNEILIESLKLEIDLSFKLIKGKLKLNINELQWDPIERCEFSLSSIPSLRKLHPNYNHYTDCDYDKISMNFENTRWTHNFLQNELTLMKKILI